MTRSARSAITSEVKVMADWRIGMEVEWRYALKCRESKMAMKGE